MKRSLFLCASLLATVSCNNDITGLGPPSDPATETFAASLNVNISQMTKLPGGTYIRDISLGAGDSVKAETDTVWVTYSLRLKDAKLIESGTNVKFTVPLLIPGFRAGLINMRVGGTRQFVIPSEQGYGSRSLRGADNKISIPRQSTLVFQVEVLKLHTPAPPTTPTP
jgi:FKBP-type peptidyl-prolyl cis-trans isomerase